MVRMDGGSSMAGNSTQRRLAPVPGAGGAEGERRAGQRYTAWMTIRPYEPRDRAAVREVCRATAYEGDGAALLDPNLFADLMTRAWTDFGAGPLWVVENDGAVQGYLAG